MFTKRHIEDSPQQQQQQQRENLESPSNGTGELAHTRVMEHSTAMIIRGSETTRPTVDESHKASDASCPHHLPAL